MAETNAKNFLGRPIAVDWAVPKEVFKGGKVIKHLTYISKMWLHSVACNGEIFVALYHLL